MRWVESCCHDYHLSSQNAGNAMSAVIHALYETGYVGVARFVARANAVPRLVALLPHIKSSHEVGT